MRIIEKTNKTLDNLYKKIPGGLFGIFSMIIGLTGDFLAALYYPGGYSILEHMISHLGTSWLNPGYYIFNIGVILCGSVAIPFDIYLGRFFEKKQGKSNWINVAVISNLISSISLIFVGISLSISQDFEDFAFFLHGLFATLCFLGAAIYCLIYSGIILNKNRFIPKHFAIFGLIVALVEILFIFTWQPFIEWLANFSIIAWIIIMSIITLKRES